MGEDFEKWWQEHGQYCRAGGGNYEKTFAYRAWEAATKRATAKHAPKPRELKAVGTGALLGEKQHCFEKGWKEGIAAFRKMLRSNDESNRTPREADWGRLKAGVRRSG